MFHIYTSHIIAFCHCKLFPVIIDLCTLHLVQALEEVEKNFAIMRVMLSGDGEVEPNPDQITQLTLEICKEDGLTLLMDKLPLLKWEVDHDNHSIIYYVMLIRYYFAYKDL